MASNDVDLVVGADTSLVGTGLAELRKYGESAVNELKGIFASTIAFSGLVAGVKAGISSVIEYGAHIHDLGEKFGISTTILQQFGNAAELNGSSLEAVAKSFNKLEVARARALGGDNAYIEAAQRLNVTFDDFKNLGPEEIVLKVGKSSMNAADMVKIFGKEALGLRVTFQQLAEDTTKLGRALDPELIAKLKAADDRYKILSQNWRVFSGNMLSWTAQIGAGIIEYLVGPLNQVIAKLTGINVLGKVANLFGTSSSVKPVVPKLGGPGGVAAGGKGAQLFDEEGNEIDTSGGGGGASKAESLRERIAKLEEEHMARAQTDQQHLNSLLSKSSELYHAQAAAVGNTNDELQARTAYLENEKEIDTLTARMAEDRLQTESRITAERVRMAGQADQDLARAEAETKQYQLQAQGQDDLAERAKIAFEFDEKIARAVQARNEASQKGFTAVANTNRALIQQLGLEKSAALAAHDKAKAEEEAARAAALHAQDTKEAAAVQSQAIPQAQQVLADLEHQRALNEELRAGHTLIAAQMQEEWDWQRKINDAAAAANEAWQLMNQAYAEGKTLLGDQYAELAKINEATQQELDLQKQISAERQNQTRWAQGMQDLANNLSGYTSDQLILMSKSFSDYLEGRQRYAQRFPGYNPAQMPGANPVFEDLIQRQMQGAQDANIRGKAAQIVANAQMRRTVPEELAFLQSSIPQLQGLIQPGESFQVVQYLQQQIDTLKQMLSELQGLNKSIAPTPGSH